MKNNKINKTYIKSIFLNLVEKNGYSNISKNLILNSSAKLFKTPNNFYKLFEKTLKNSILPVIVFKDKNKYKYKNSSANKSIAIFVSNLISCIQNSKNRRSFDFYFKNEMYKMFKNLNYTNESKQNLIKLYNNIEFTPIIKNNKPDKNIKLITNKQNKIQVIHKQFNNYFSNCKNTMVHLNKNKPTMEENCNNLSLNKQITNINFI